MKSFCLSLLYTIVLSSVFVALSTLDTQTDEDDDEVLCDCFGFCCEHRPCMQCCACLGVAQRDFY